MYAYIYVRNLANLSHKSCHADLKLLLKLILTGPSQTWTIPTDFSPQYPKREMNNTWPNYK